MFLSRGPVVAVTSVLEGRILQLVLELDRRNMETSLLNKTMPTIF